VVCLGRGGGVGGGACVVTRPWGKKARIVGEAKVARRGKVLSQSEEGGRL